MLNRGTVIIFILSALLLLAGCRQGERAAAPKGPEPCPKIDGSYFGSDKAEIRKGEGVTLSYRVPGVYAAGTHIEGVEYSPPPAISSFKAGPGDSPLASPTPLPEWYEYKMPDVRLEKTTTFILRAKGPEGCQPLELPTTVKVVE